MKRIITFVFAALLSLPLSAQNETILDTGDAVPDFNIEMLDGSTVRMSDLRGKVVALNFWATWCPYCVRELDHITRDNVLERYEGEDFVFIAVDRGEAKQTVSEFADRKGYRFGIGLDESEDIFKIFAEQGIPRTYVIGRDGVITGYVLGYTEELLGELVAKIDETLKTN
ncbi:MAG: TlpA family protein disulfide reductase [Rikenellaceae bacterium]|nr:TlpA family protein disulfide reductase [Rikenellaceae bacterium]